jgi:uncharacterized membrane protein
MNFGNVKLLYVFSCVALCLVIFSPTLLTVVSSPKGELFSEMWLLGSDGLTEGYPFVVSVNEVYNIRLGVGNYMGSLEYYAIYVKFRNQIETFPDSAAGLPSSLEPIFEYRVFLGNNETWEKPVSFSFEDVSFDGNVSRVSNLSIDGRSVSVDKTAVLDEDGLFYYQLFFELWIYNTKTANLEFHNRFVWLWLALTGSQ